MTRRGTLGKEYLVRAVLVLGERLAVERDQSEELRTHQHPI